MVEINVSHLFVSYVVLGLNINVIVAYVFKEFMPIIVKQFNSNRKE